MLLTLVHVAIQGVVGRFESGNSYWVVLPTRIGTSSVCTEREIALQLPPLRPGLGELFVGLGCGVSSFLISSMKAGMGVPPFMPRLWCGRFVLYNKI